MKWKFHPSLPKWLNQFGAKLFSTHFNILRPLVLGNRVAYFLIKTVLELIKWARLFVTTRKKKVFLLVANCHMCQDSNQRRLAYTTRGSLHCLWGEKFHQLIKTGLLARVWQKTLPLSTMHEIHHFGGHPARTDGNSSGLFWGEEAGCAETNRRWMFNVAWLLSCVYGGDPLGLGTPEKRRRWHFRINSTLSLEKEVGEVGLLQALVFHLAIGCLRRLKCRNVASSNSMALMVFRKINIAKLRLGDNVFLCVGRMAARLLEKWKIHVFFNC